MGQPMAGLDACRLHAGVSNETARAKGLANLQAIRAQEAVATYGLPRDIDPHDALREEIARTAGHVAWLGDIVASIDPDALTQGVTSVVHKEGVSDQGNDVWYDQTTSAAGASVWLSLYQAERKHLVDVCAAAIRCGLAEREVRLAEQQGALIAQVIRALIEDPELGLDAGSQEVARRVASRHLRALPAA
jgi:hypothetical protein